MTCIEHKQKGDKDGYGSTVRYLNGERKYLRLHRCVFFDNNGYWPEVVRHTCDNPRCINPAHLVAGSVLDNNRDRDERGRTARQAGETNGMARLSDADCELIRTSNLPRRILAERYGITLRHVFRIRAGERR